MICAPVRGSASRGTACAIFRRAILCGRCAQATGRFFIKPSGIVGVVEIVGEARPDPTQFDPESRYFDAKASLDAPRWDLVVVQFVRAFSAMVSLAQLKDVPALAGMEVVRKGSRLSVSPVTPAEWQAVLALAGEAVDGY